MIVKNESKVIRRCLESVIPIIDSWMIIDTGSTDGTQSLIRDCLRGIPGALHERAWIDFAANRNEALNLAKERSEADYLLFIDADEKLEFSERFVMPVWSADTYLGTVRLPQGGSEFSRGFMVRRKLNCYWRGVVHEELICRRKKSLEVLKDPLIVSIGDGCRSQDRSRFFKDAKKLEVELAKNPRNARLLFLLAQCYLGARSFERALYYYRQRASMDYGWEGEIYLSLYAIAQIERICKKATDVWSRSYWNAFDYYPYRAEPLFWINTYLLTAQKYQEGYELASKALEIPFPTDTLPIERWIYDYGLLLQLADFCYFLGKRTEAREALNKLLMFSLPAQTLRLVEENLRKLYV